MSRAVVLADLDPAAHVRHSLHGADRVWVEKNCYIDVWIELLHALGLEPHACLAFVFGIDFEDDQWTFFKPPLCDLRSLYGIDVQEMSVWRPLLEHAAEHLRAGKLVSVEVDAFWLPDTAGTDYRSSHAKTTIVLNDLDPGARRLGYFHNAGYYELAGEDFEGHFATERSAIALPPYAELIRIDRSRKLPEAELRAQSARLHGEHLVWLAPTNPIVRFAARMDADLGDVRAGGLDRYHAWAFAGIRQLGAAAELASLYLDWLCPQGEMQAAAACYALVARHSKTLILKAARSVHSGRALDADALLEEMAAAWDRGTAALARA